LGFLLMKFINLTLPWSYTPIVDGMKPFDCLLQLYMDRLIHAIPFLWALKAIKSVVTLKS